MHCSSWPTRSLWVDNTAKWRNAHNVVTVPYKSSARPTTSVLLVLNIIIIRVWRRNADYICALCDNEIYVLSRAICSDASNLYITGLRGSHCLRFAVYCLPIDYLYQSRHRKTTILFDINSRKCKVLWRYKWMVWTESNTCDMLITGWRGSHIRRCAEYCVIEM